MSIQDRILVGNEMIIGCDIGLHPNQVDVEMIGTRRPPGWHTKIDLCLKCAHEIEGRIAHLVCEALDGKVACDAPE